MLDTRARLLVCAIPETLEAAQDTLGHVYQCVYCLKASEAFEALNLRPRAIVCNLHFDEGRMFDFLWSVRRNPAAKPLPFVVLHTRDSMTPAMLRSVEAATAVVGIEAFLEVRRWLDELGKEDTQSLIQQVVAAEIAKSRFRDLSTAP